MNVLLDTSVWIDHFRTANLDVIRLLETDRVVCHEFVIAELACGSLKARDETLGYLKALRSLSTLSTNEVLLLIESRALYSRGIGMVDAQLLASTLVSPDTQLLTLDTRLNELATELEIAYRKT